MEYQVRFVGNSALPEGVEYAFACQAGETFLFVKRSAVNAVTGHPDALSRARETWQRSAVRAEVARTASA